jgi:FkbM family methyltransferase
VYGFKTTCANPVIIDCGANIGLSVLYFKECYPNCEIIAFEPNPNSFILLKMNVKKNNLKGVQLFNCALSNENRSVDFFVPHKKGSLNASSKNINESDEIIVRCKKLSDFVWNKKIDFIKMDIEGDEEKVIKDLKENNILESVNELVVEFHYPINSSSPNLSKFLKYFEETHFYDNAGIQNKLGDHDNDAILHFKKKEPRESI